MPSSRRSPSRRAESVLVLAAALTAAARADAQLYTTVRSPATALSAPAAFSAATGHSSPLPAFTPSLPAAMSSPSPLAAPVAVAAPASVVGMPGPGVSEAHVAAVQRLADSTGVTWLIHGSRQTGVSAHDGKPFRPDSDLDLGVVGGWDEMVAASHAPWDTVPDAEHLPMRLESSAETAAGKGLLVIAPRREEARGALGLARSLAAPYRTAPQLARLSASPRAEGERFRFEVIGDAEPGRFWFSRALFNKETGAFWKLLRRADRAGADFIVQLGDMVSRGSLRNFLSFFLNLRAHAPRTPYLTVIGNHDRRDPHGVSDDRVYRELFGGTDYAFTRAGWRFVVVDSSAGRITKEQLKWLSEVVDRDLPTVVFTHIPPAPLGEWTDFGRKGAGGFREGSVEFMRLMSERGVKRVYMGHVHALDTLERGGVRYVLTGGGGSPLYPGPVARRLHHSLSVEVGPDGFIEETVRPLVGAPHALR